MPDNPTPRLVILALGVGLALALPTAWPRPGTDAARSRGVGRPPAQVSATATGPALPDLTLSWRWDYWFEHCLPPSQPSVLTLEAANRGPVAAGPFVIQDRRAQWRVPGLAPGAVYYQRQWAYYPAFPLVVDPYQQVVEADEGNNIVEPPTAGPPWTRTPRAAMARATPPPGRASGSVRPAALMTQPIICTPRPPAPTLTPAGEPPLPDLAVDGAAWDRLVIQYPDERGPCWPTEQPWRFTLTVRNGGDAPAGWFSVGGDGAGWQVPGLPAGAVKTLASEPRFLPRQLRIGLIDGGQERDEANNEWHPPAGGMPTPAGTAPPFCAQRTTPTPGPSRTATSTVTRGPSISPSPTPTGGHSPTPSRTPSPAPTATDTPAPTRPPLLLPALRRTA